MLPNLLKRIKFGVIVQNDELHKTLDYFSSAVIPFKDNITSTKVDLPFTRVGINGGNSSERPYTQVAKTGVNPLYIAHASQHLQRTTHDALQVNIVFSPFYGLTPTEPLNISYAALCIHCHHLNTRV